MKAEEAAKVQAYLKRRFGNVDIALKPRPKVNDSVEVLLGNEFIGVIYKDEDEGEISYQFQMCIIEEDLDL